MTTRTYTIHAVKGMRGERYYVDTGDGLRLHILTREALKWYLKRTCQLTQPEALTVMSHLNQYGLYGFELDFTSAAS